MDPQLSAQHPSESQPVTTLKLDETTPVIEDIGTRFQQLASEIFEKGLMARKSEEELKQMTASLVLQILSERWYKMDDEIMNPYFQLTEKIRLHFCPPVETQATNEQPQQKKWRLGERLRRLLSLAA